MNHHIFYLLQHWLAHKDEGQWLLATVIKTRGSAYRKAGAMMLFSDSGDQFGVVSGGCLESDLFHHARKCWLSGQSRTVTYDMQEEGDVAWRLGIGCGGEVTLLLQPLTADNNYLQLPDVFSELQSHRSVVLSHCICGAANQIKLSASNDAKHWFTHRLTPPQSLFIGGGGVDAVPVADIAARLGWQVTVNDERARYARSADFHAAYRCHSLTSDQLPDNTQYHQAGAIIIMHHQVGLDAKMLATIAQCPPKGLRYLAVLGPGHRTQRVLDEAGIQPADLPVALHSPAGFNIGGELPESIALSMLAQAHAVLHQKPLEQAGEPW